MSTIYIYPIDQKDHLHHQQQNNEPSLSPLKSLSATGLSRILEIPLCLLENANSNDQQQQQQVYWLTNAHLSNNNNNSSNNNNNGTSSNVTSKEDASTITATNELVTHSFANRKRSIVKRRKSVLSASFTAEDEAEAIRIDREHTLAALERGHRSEGERNEETKQETVLEHDPSSDKESTFEASNSLYSQQNLTFDVNHDDVHGLESVAKAQEMNRGNLKKEEQEEQEEKTRIPFNPVKEQQQQQTEGANVVSPKDSAIDLRTTALEQEKEDTEQHGLVVDDNENNNHSCTKVIDLSLASTSHSSFPSMTLKKKSSWSPRRIFFTSKKSTLIEKQEKFNISSLFSRKSSSPSSKKSNSSKKSLECINTSKNDSCASLQKSVLFNYTRLPIHTERAIYRLSHLKLANPRRPLRDQVIISNLMFWYLSIVSANNNHTENEPAPMEHLVMTKKVCRMQQQQIQNKKRRMRNQIRPENSNAMDFISKQPKKPHHQHAPHVNKKSVIRSYSTSNSSSEEEDDDDDDHVDRDSDTDSDDNSDSFSFTSSTSSLSTSEDIDSLKTKKTKKYSLFNKDKKWLPSFSKGNTRQQQEQQQDEDDIPLAMYQKK